MKYILIKPGIAEKFNQFCEQGRILFLSAACGFGKTTIANNLLKKQKALNISAQDNIDNLFSDNDSSREFLLIDNLQVLQDPAKQQALINLIRENPQKRFVFLSRGNVPGWLMPFQISGLLTVIGYHEMLFDRSETFKVLEKSGISVSEDELSDIFKDTQGYPLLLALIIDLMSAGREYGTELFCEVREKLFLYYEESIFQKYELPMRRFILSLALFDEVNPELAKIASGDCRAEENLRYLYQYSGMLKLSSTETYCFGNLFRDFLRWKTKNDYSNKQIRTIYDRGGLYYELCENYGKALEFYSKSGDSSMIPELIIKDLNRHFGIETYEELGLYFEMLNDEQILLSPALMQGMSMFRSLQGNYTESERWYSELKSFAAARNNLDEACKEAKGRLVSLDITLPQRRAEYISEAAKLVANEKIKPAPFSITDMTPSIINGGKDFSEQSQSDETLYTSIRESAEILFGERGAGLAECAVAESKFARGKDISGQILKLVSKLHEIQNSGMPDTEFAVAALLAENQILTGYAQAAVNTVLTLRDGFNKRNLLHFLPNMDALLCRTALRTGNMLFVEKWYTEKAPKNILNVTFLKRYLYLTQAMVELAFGFNDAVLLTLAPLEPLFEACLRHIDMIHLKTMSAIAKYRKADNAWIADIAAALDISAEYGFVHPVGSYGILILPLLEEYISDKTENFAADLIKITKAQAANYPEFLIPACRKVKKLTGTEIQVLRLLCADKSNAEIGTILDIQLTTVKSHISHILQKLGAKRRSEAKTIAQNLKII